MIKDILVNLEMGKDSDPAATYAISVAQLFESHVAGVAYALKPVIGTTPFEAISLSAIGDTIAQNKKLAEASIMRFEMAAKRSCVPVQTFLATEILEDAAIHFAELSRTADISIVSQATPDNLGYSDVFIESALFGSGRPVIIVPYVQKDPIKLDRVTCCWDGSQHAARAIADSLPLLRKASRVDVLTVKTGRNETEQDGCKDVARHLARHGLKVEQRDVFSADVDVGNAILSYVADQSTDLLVMGGYGHSRFREFVLGGATRVILSSMTIPTFMAH